MSEAPAGMPPIATEGEGLGYTEEEWLYRKNLRKFCEEEMDPRFRETFTAEASHDFYKEFMKKLGEQGNFKMMIPEALGGYGQRTTYLYILVEEVARANGGLGVHCLENPIFGMQMAMEIPAAFAEWGEGILSGDLIIACAENSPEGSMNFSEIGGCFAKLEGDEWVINGNKVFSSGATFSDVILVAGLIDGDQYRFAMDAKNTPGLKITPNPQMGVTPEYGTVELTNVRIPKEFGVRTGGVVDHKFQAAIPAKAFPLGVGFLALGSMGAAFDKTVEYLKNRTSDFKPLASLGSIQYKLASMKGRIEASRALLITATRMIETNHKDTFIYAPMAKQFACDTAREITSDCVQLWGCVGYNPETGIERYCRDAVGFGIGCCTSEMHLASVAKYMGLPGAEFEAL